MKFVVPSFTWSSDQDEIPDTTTMITTNSGGYFLLKLSSSPPEVRTMYFSMRLNCKIIHEDCQRDIVLNAGERETERERERERERCLDLAHIA